MRRLLGIPDEAEHEQRLKNRTDRIALLEQELRDKFAALPESSKTLAHIAVSWLADAGRSA